MALPPLMRTLIAGSAALLVMVSTAAAQEPPPPPPTEETEAIQRELAQIQEQLQQIEERAMEEDPTLQEEQDALQDLFLETMTRIDPNVEQTLDRLDGLQEEIQTAQQAQDMERLQELVAEGQQLQQQIGQAQAAAMQDERLTGEIEAYEEKVISKMEEIEPETPTLMARLQELASQLRPDGGL
jgi:DNA repair exonuclease SbcCD ATPase subunit